MPVFEIEHRAALGGRTPPTFRGVRIAALPEGHVVHVLAKASDGDLSGAVRAAAGGDASSVRFVSPGQWFVVGDAPLSREGLSSLAAALKPVADIVDQSHGRVRIGLSGGKSAEVLAKGTAVDLALSEFPVGRAAATLVGHIGVHLARTAEDAFELLVLRGFAESLWDDLTEMAAEFR